MCSAARAQFTPEARVFNPRERGAITVGADTLCMGELLVGDDEGVIEIGDWCFIGPQSKLRALDRIRVGSRVFVSHGVQIFDNNSHSLSASERHQRFRELSTVGRHLQPETIVRRAIVIEDDVWIGFNAAILKGVTVGKGAVIGACAVVTHDVEPYAVVVGNPARRVGNSRP